MNLLLFWLLCLLIYGYYYNYSVCTETDCTGINHTQNKVYDFRKKWKE